MTTFRNDPIANPKIPASVAQTAVVTPAMIPSALIAPTQDRDRAGRIDKRLDPELQAPRSAAGAAGRADVHVEIHDVRRGHRDQRLVRDIDERGGDVWTARRADR